MRFYKPPGLLLILFLPLFSFHQKEHNTGDLENEKYLNYLAAVENHSTFNYFTVITVKNLNTGEIKEICTKGNFVSGALHIELKKYLSLVDEAVWQALNLIFRSDQFLWSEKGGMGTKTFFFPYFLFNFFNKLIMVIDPKKEKPIILLSQNAPTHSFLFMGELEKLVTRLNKILGQDIEDVGDFRHTEIVDGTWKSRSWKKDILSFDLTKSGEFIQAYLNFD